MGVIADLGPDAVLTSGRAATAQSDPADPDSETREAMERAITQAWSELADQGIPVIGILDNPSPDRNVYECVADSPLPDCAFDKAQGIDRSSAGHYQAAHEEVGASALIDIREYICPGD